MHVPDHFDARNRAAIVVFFHGKTERTLERDVRDRQLVRKQISIRVNAVLLAPQLASLPPITSAASLAARRAKRSWRCQPITRPSLRRPGAAKAFANMPGRDVGYAAALAGGLEPGRRPALAIATRRVPARRRRWRRWTSSLLDLRSNHPLFRQRLLRATPTATIVNDGMLKGPKALHLSGYGGPLPARRAVFART